MKQLSLLICVLSFAFPVSASAAEIESVNGESTYVKRSSAQVSDEEGITIALEENEPVSVEFPDGRIETFTYKVEDVDKNGTAGIQSTSVTKRASVTRDTLTASLE